ncbi:MAG: diheme cytochrome c [Dissulfurispiraceae bacterium]|jgi:cytochrome c553|nr:diheme cytochrome c [Dissulfurispiraceae bacterium]
MRGLIIIVLFLILSISSYAIAGSKKYEQKVYAGQSKQLKQVSFKPYIDECGSCHFAFQPELLPARSWQRMMKELDDHFGDDASLDSETTEQISLFLKKESAEQSSSKRAKKFLSLIRPDESPLRITETRYFLKKHDEVEPHVYKRKSIGSPANCSACHTTADKGNYSDKFVKIPRQ